MEEPGLEDIEFDLLLKEKRHKELIDVLKKILLRLDSDSISKSIEKSISLLITKDSNKLDKEIPSSIVSIGNAIIKKIEEINKVQTKEWVFSIERNTYGYISSVIAKQK